jgi:methyl-accepting chemotaxis protein
MSQIAELDRRLTNVEVRLGMEHEPPMDRLSGIEHRLDTVQALVQANGLSIGDLARRFGVMEIRQLEHGRAIADLCRTVNKHSEAITQHSEAIAQQSAAIAEQSTAITQQAAAITQQGAAITQQGAAITQQSTAITRQGAAITEIQTGVRQLVSLLSKADDGPA